MRTCAVVSIVRCDPPLHTHTHLTPLNGCVTRGTYLQRWAPSSSLIVCFSVARACMTVRYIAGSTYAATDRMFSAITFSFSSALSSSSDTILIEPWKTPQMITRFHERVAHGTEKSEPRPPAHDGPLSSRTGRIQSSSSSCSALC